MILSQLTHAPKKFGAPGGIRTPNLLIRSQMLYPLSYGRMAEMTGFEPADLVKGQLLSREPHSATLAHLQTEIQTTYNLSANQNTAR